jgi:hypothetical protein
MKSSILCSGFMAAWSPGVITLNWLDPSTGCCEKEGSVPSCPGFTPLQRSQEAGKHGRKHSLFAITTPYCLGLPRPGFRSGRRRPWIASRLRFAVR